MTNEQINELLQLEINHKRREILLEMAEHEGILSSVEDTARAMAGQNIPATMEAQLTPRQRVEAAIRERLNR